MRGLEHAKSYCSEVEQIENFEKAKLDNFKGWHCHHRLETHNSDGQERMVFISKDELIALDMYYHRPPEELIFMTSFEHLKLHNSGAHNALSGKHLTDEQKRKAVATRTRNGSYKMSEETKRKIISTKMKNGTNKHSEETKRKISKANLANRDLHSKITSSLVWVNDGFTNKRVLPNEIPEGFKLGKLPHKSCSLKGKKWKVVDGKRVWYEL